MRFINLGLEEDTPNPESVELDPNETAQAIAAVDNQDSTEPAKVLQLANYKEELAILRAKSQEAADNEESDATDAPVDTPVEGEREGEETPAPVEGEEKPTDTPSEGDDNAEPPVEETDSQTDNDDADEEAVEQTPGTAEMGKDAPGKSDAEVAQESFIVKGHKMALEALDSMQEMAKYQQLLKKRLSLDGISPQTAGIITHALEFHSVRCGYDVTDCQAPALEDFTSYSGSSLATRELSVAVEGFLEATWEAIKKFFKSIWKWIMDILSGKKGGTPDCVQRPQSKDTRDKAIKVIEDKVKVLEKKDEDIMKLREKDTLHGKVLKVTSGNGEKLPKGIAKALFKNNDKGTYNEALANAKTLCNVTDAFNNMLKPLGESSVGFITKLNAGQDGGLSNFTVDKNVLGSIPFSEMSSLPNGLVEGTTEEITGGVSACFTYAGTKGSALEKLGVIKASSILGKQGLKFVSDKKEQDEMSLYPMEQTDLHMFRVIITEIQRCFSAINNSQSMLEKMTGIIKGVAESSQPKAWATLDAQRIAELKAQVTFMAAIDTSMAAGYKSLENQINTFYDGFSKLADIHSK